MTLTLNSIYQDSINLLIWLESLPNEITHINLFVPLNCKHKLVQADYSEFNLTFIPLDTPELFLNFQSIFPSNDGWQLNYPMHYQLSATLLDEIVSITRQQTVEKKVYSKEKGRVEFLGETVKKGGYCRDTVLILFYKDQTPLSDLVYWPMQQLVGPIEQYTPQNFDDFHLELDVKQQVLSYLDFKKGKKYSTIQFFTKPLATFLYRGLIKGGFFEGKPGFALAYLYALSSFKRVLFLRMKYKSID